MELSQQNHCLNCDEVLTTPFCGACGQKKAERISLRVLLKIAQRGIIEFKSPLLVTLWGLTIHPGKVYREYLDGRRATYFNPIRYSFWLITLCILASSFFEVPLFDFSLLYSQAENEGKQELNELSARLLETSVVYMYFIFALFHAAFTRLFFRKEKRKFSELYVACLLCSSHFSIVYTLLIMLGLYGSATSIFIVTIGGFLYGNWAIATFFRFRIMNYIKSALAYVVGLFCFSIVIGLPIGVYSGIKAAELKNKQETLQMVEEVVAPSSPLEQIPQ